MEKLLSTYHLKVEHVELHQEVFDAATKGPGRYSLKDPFAEGIYGEGLIANIGDRKGRVLDRLAFLLCLFAFLLGDGRISLLPDY